MNYSNLARVSVAAALLFAPLAAIADLDNKGTEFIVAYTPNYYDGNVDLHLTSDVATQATINYPVTNPTFTQTVDVNPGQVTIVELPDAVQNAWVADVVGNNGVEIKAGQEVVAYMINRASATSDAALALPLDTMNTEYIVSTYDEAFRAAQFVVIAGFDGTTVTITPSNDAQGGHAAGVPFNATLNRGEGILVRGTNTGKNGGLAGSIVTADKPVGVTNGNGCTQVPIGTTACDTLMEVAQPTASWGSEVLVVNLPNRPSGSVYRAVASQDNTTVSVDGVALGTINRGQYLETAVLPGNHVIAGDKPIFVTQYMTGQDFQGASQGDPAMGNMVPSAQYLNSYTFSTVGGGQFATHYLNVIASNADIGSVTLDGSPIDPAQFSAIPGTSFSGATVQLTEGTHTTASPNPHGISVSGFGSYDSYLYPGGALFKFINPVGDSNPPVCQVVKQSQDGVVYVSGAGVDNRATEDTNSNGVLDAGEDLNGNGEVDKDKGIFFIELLPGSVNLTLNVAPFVPGTGVVAFSATRIDVNQNGTGTVRITDGAGNTCEASVDTVLDAPTPTPTATPVPGDCTTVEATAESKAKGNAVLARARQLVKRTRDFANRAASCGGSKKQANSSIVSAQSLFEGLKETVEVNFTSSKVVCADSLCTESSSKAASGDLKRLTNKLFWVQKRAKLRAIAQCEIRHDPNVVDTRKNSEGYRDDVLKAIRKLPSTVTQCTQAVNQNT